MSSASAAECAPALPRIRRIAAVINRAAGGVAATAPDVMHALAADHGLSLDLVCPAPDELEPALRAAIDRAPDLLVVLAGDGTARLAAELAGVDGPLLAPLPGGTMNLLSRALYGPSPWTETLATVLEHGVERPVGGGRVGGKLFFAAAVLGPPALWGRAREAVRLGDLAEALRRARYALRRAFAGELRYRLEGGPERRAEALVLISPLVSRAAGEEPALEAAALDVRRAGEVVRLAVKGALGSWRDDPSVEVSPCTRGIASARKSIPCILDGEPFRLPRRCAFWFEPRAFRALVPPPAGAT
jgi:diacylglycerol kinase family enzyme